ncbi:hypothetical protein ACE6H2_020502 [Prunus campanulata]
MPSLLPQWPQELQDIGMPSVPLVFGIVSLVEGLFPCLGTCLHGKPLSWS